ncbi:decapping and exoribonuclease protein-like isoform X2 [Tachypleus tridentatus]|uniref:decapping and exoribonuclease protein-like isoform X2 n=1 Tax=Tachypleus tridentatus TaxID=6853 RepID=UPI003FCF02BD
MGEKEVMNCNLFRKRQYSSLEKCCYIGEMQVHHCSKYEREFPFFREPQVVGCFSLDSNRGYCDDNHQLKYLHVPPDESKVNFDLNAGYEKVIKKSFELNEKLDNLLQWIIRNKKKIQVTRTTDKDVGLNTDFICYRGLLTTILVTVYEQQEDWQICATRFQNTIYLCAFNTEKNKKRQMDLTEKDKLMTSWGYKFEQYMTSEKEGQPPDLMVSVNEKEEYCSVLRSRLNRHSLVYGAEVDCLDPVSQKSDKSDKCSSLQHFVELKTSRKISHPKQERNFCRYKLLKWWAQSFLAGIPRVICGFRNDNGIVEKLQIFSVKEIPQEARGFWSPATCMNFCDEFLSFVQKNVTIDDPQCPVIRC